MAAIAAPDPSSSTGDGHAAERQITVNKPLTSNRTRAAVENPEYAAFARRILKAYARRIASGDIESLTLMAELADTIDASIRDAVTAPVSRATPGRRSAPSSASPARPPSSAGETGRESALTGS
jgi:hypothetical protein